MQIYCFSMRYGKKNYVFDIFFGSQCVLSFFFHIFACNKIKASLQLWLTEENLNK